MANSKKLIAVPTAYNIYRVSDDVINMHKAELMMFPPAVVLETLVLQGLAKVVARITPFDIENTDDEEDIEVPDRYEMGDADESPAPENPGEEELPGPWYPKEDDDDERS